jgi:hypothetical protein
MLDGRFHGSLQVAAQFAPVVGVHSQFNHDRDSLKLIWSTAVPEIFQYTKQGRMLGSIIWVASGLNPPTW